MRINRREFLSIIGGLGLLTLAPKGGSGYRGKYATLIDITKCDGCVGENIPRCVASCRKENESRFPEPKKPIMPYWPRKTYEDWSDKREEINTLTPYNWIFVQQVEVEGKKVFIPRRCMHCDSPPCVKGCPFGALTRNPYGNTVIDHNLCMGGAKCRDVCPWGIPQRQAGVGLYLKLFPKYAGGGVMYKCDLCDSRIKKGLEPACVAACKERLKEKAPLDFGLRESIIQKAKRLASSENLYTYGDIQNGGTATIYLSNIPFEKIDLKLKESGARFGLPQNVKNRYLSEINPWGKAIIGSAIAGAAIGILGSLIKKNKD